VVAAHLLTHRQPTVLAVCDVAMLAARVGDWSGFAARVEPGFRPAVGAALALARDIFGAKAPIELVEELIGSGGARAKRLLRHAPAEMWSRRLRGLALLGTTARGWRALFPSRGQTAVTFGVDSRSPGFIFWRLVHPLRQMAVGLSGLLALKP
jgi:hypothetical protein